MRSKLSLQRSDPFFCFELYEVIAGFVSKDLCDDCIHAGEVIVQAAHEEIHIHRRPALEVCQCIDEQAALEHEVFRVFGACQPAQEFLLKEQLQALLTGCEERLAAAKAAYDTRLAEYIAAENAYNPVFNKAAACQTARTKYSAQRRVVANLEQMVLSARAQADSDSAQAAALSNQFETTKDSILSRLRAELELAERTLNKTDVLSPRDGVVAELPVSVGTMVGPGTEIVKFSGSNDPGVDYHTVVVCLIPFSSGQEIAEGMTVMVCPTTVNKEEYGHMEATVLSVDYYAASDAGMQNLVGADLLDQSVTQEGPVLAVTCALRTDSSTASGYS